MATATALLFAGVVFAISNNLRRGQVISETESHKKEYNITPITPFNVLMLSGNLNTWVTLENDAESSIEIPKRAVADISFHIKNDTLVVNEVASESSHNNYSIRLHLGKAGTVVATNADIHYASWNHSPAPAFRLSDCSFSLSQSYHAGTASTRLQSDNRVDSLRISLTGKGSINFDDDVVLQQLYANLQGEAEIELKKNVQHVQLTAGDSTKVQAYGFHLNQR